MQETKGQATKHHILKEGLMLASIKGLVNISIGGLAAKANMSRSGLFAHFLSKEQLQLEILEFAYNLFERTIMEPCKQIASPVGRLRYLQKEVPSWYEKTDPKIPGGCIFLMACLEFDDRPGKIRNNLLHQHSRFLDFLKDTHEDAVKAREFTGVTTKENFAFVFYSLYMGYNQYKKFFGDENARYHFDYAIDRLIQYAMNITPEAMAAGGGQSEF